MSISDSIKKLPLINSSNKFVKIFGYALYAFLILTVLGAILPSPPDNNLAEASQDSKDVNVQTLSVVVDGWNFSANLDDRWRLGSEEVEDWDMVGYNSAGTNLDAEPNWDGVALTEAFWLPKKGENLNPRNLPDINTEKSLLATVSVMVYKVPEELREWEAHDLFMDLEGDPFSDQSQKDIEFNGRPAWLSESVVSEDVYQWDKKDKLTMQAQRYSVLDILITDDTVVSIFVVTLPESGLEPWDVIEKFTVSPN